MELSGDVFQLLFEQADVSTILQSMRINPKAWKAVIERDALWMNLINTKNFRDLLYHTYKDAITYRGHWDDGNVHLPFVAEFLWKIVSEQGRPRIYSMNERTYVTFLVLWTAFPHIFVDDQGLVTRIQCTSIAKAPALVKAFERLKENDGLEDWSSGYPGLNWTTPATEVLTDYIASLTPETLNVNGLKVPYFHLDVQDDFSVIVRNTSLAPKKPFLLRVWLRDNSDDDVEYQWRYNHLTQRLEKMPDSGDFYADVFIKIRTQMDALDGRFILRADSGSTLSERAKKMDMDFMYVFVTYHNRADTLHVVVPDDVWGETQKLRPVYNHVRILGKAGRIGECIECVNSRMGCSECKTLFCNACFSDHLKDGACK